ncbi:MAG: NAD(P)/FAD-dependent oxidoreductase [Rhodovarius sp.]|nr:NAD(P)/FAD-dependent oxidoreductase [Rhodovarius sp.]
MTLPARDSYDLVVVGAGPAGMGAVAECAGQGISLLWVDEQPSPGGQVHRGLAAPLSALAGAYQRGLALLSAARAAQAEYLPGATVWQIEPGASLGVSVGGASRLVAARRVILATGALERPMPIPGWTLPGVMTVGGAQTLLKAQGLVPSGRVVLVGTGPLLWLFAAQMLAVGARPALILDTTPAGNARRALRHLPGFLASPYLARGLGLLRRVRRAVPVRRGEHPAIRPRPAGGLLIAWESGEAEADLILLHQGVVPHLHAAQAAGCALAWSEAQACFVPVTDAWGESSIPGIAIAGDGAGIAGAEAAEYGGRIAALQALAALGRIDAATRDARAAPLLAARARWLAGRAFLDALFLPKPAQRQAAPEAIACRCEEVSGAALRQAVRQGATGPNQLKAFLRCGMGPCQGRQCALTVVETIAAERGLSPAAIGPLRARNPIKPVTLAEIAAMPVSEADIAAVLGRR